MISRIDRTGLTPNFWRNTPMERLNEQEWEALCDGCGKCCLNKLEDDETGEVALTRVACRLLDDETCRCAQYDIRHQFVPDCIVLRPSNIEANLYWMPQTCAYRLIYEGRDLYDWHPLLSGSEDSVHAAGISMQRRTIPEFDIDDDEWEDHIIEEPV